LVVSRIERLARTLTELTEVLTSLGERQAELRICHWDPAPIIEPSDLAEIMQRLVDFETSNRGELTRAGIAAARAKGRIGGRPTALTGDLLIRCSITASFSRSRSMRAASALAAIAACSSSHA